MRRSVAPDHSANIQEDQMKPVRPFEPSPSNTNLSDSSIPVPIAFGGIGLLLSWAVPGGLSGGGGFVLGFVLGCVLLLIRAAVQPRGERNSLSSECYCPRCEALLRV